MKVKYVGPVYEGYIPRVGRFIRGEVYDYPDEIALILLKNTGFRLVEPPRKVRRARAPGTRRASRASRPKVEEKIVEEKPKMAPAWVKPKKEEPLVDPPREREEPSPLEDEVKIEKKTPKEV